LTSEPQLISSSSIISSSSAQANALTHIATTNVVGNSNDTTSATDGLAGLPKISCIFCKSYKTQIEFDLGLHLQERHRMELIKKLSMGNGYHSIEQRADYAVKLCKERDQ
jgi:hypothetical protein